MTDVRLAQATQAVLSDAPTSNVRTSQILQLALGSAPGVDLHVSTVVQMVLHDPGRPSGGFLNTQYLRL